MIVCTECRYFKNTGCISDPGKDYCEHPNNLTHHHNWRNRWTGNIRSPRKINKVNDCEWFEYK